MPPVVLSAQISLPSQPVVYAGSDQEDVLRLGQLTGEVPLYPWGVRAFSPAELRHLTGDTARAARWDRPTFELLPVEASMAYNSHRPYLRQRYGAWEGRGVSVAGTAGLHAAWRGVSLTAAPQAFWAQNADFDLVPTRREGRLKYADALNPARIDRPQRFGEEPYASIGAGQSTLRVQGYGVTAAVSSANQWWGPARRDPLILGNNAEGFPHLTVGTARPWNLWVGRAHGNVTWGRLGESAYSPAAAGARSRLMAGFVGTLEPAGLPGLEVGASRFYHVVWRDRGSWLDVALTPFDGILKVNLPPSEGGPHSREGRGNQLASVFFRWALPQSGVEVYGEYAREDHNWDLRDFLLEPDQQRAYTIGVRRVFSDGRSGRWVLSGELLHAQISHLVHLRNQAPFYRHGSVHQGHTHRGGILGSPHAYGGARSGVDFGHLGRDGGWEVSWERVVVRDPRSYGTRWQQPEVLHAWGWKGHRNTAHGTGTLRFELIRRFDAFLDQGHQRAGFEVRSTFGIARSASLW